ncbi:MAG: hypothetical protein NUW21_16335 [Elusimicrobia bacterium]|nr:hypothetical protein [Elusimicrobiota bacterium]
MRRGCCLVVILAAAAAAGAAGFTPVSFPLEQPVSPVSEEFPGEAAPLFGQAPPLRFVHYAGREGPDEHEAVLREIRYLRDFYRHYGLFLPVEERVYVMRPAAGASRPQGGLRARLKSLGILGPAGTMIIAMGDLGGAEEDGVAAAVLAKGRKDVLRASGKLLGLPGVVSRAGLTGRDVEVLRKRYAFPPPAPSRDPYHRPAIRDYAATAEDFRMLERGLEDAGKVAGRIFPDLIEQVDVILYDTSYLYIYSYNSGYRFPKFKRWRGRQVYRVAHHSRPEEHEMWGCAGGLTVLSRENHGAMSELYFACSPWGSFGSVQKTRRSIYRFAEGYWASIIHEYGHQFQERMSSHPTPTMIEIENRILSMKLEESTRPYSAIREGFATWCELSGARLLYPAHYRRMMEQVKRYRRDDPHGHEAGLTAAAAVLDEAAAPASP